MSEFDQKPIEDILSDWLQDCGEERRGKSGAPYYKIGYKSLWESFEVLLTKLLENGYEEKYIKSVELNTKIGKTIWPDHLADIFGSQGKLNSQREKYLSLWYTIPGKTGTIRSTVVSQKFRGKVHKAGDPKEIPITDIKNRKKDSKIIDTDPDWHPKDRYRVDATDIPDPEIDEEFMNELRKVNGEICE